MDAGRVAYNEYKFQVCNERLAYLRDILDAHYHGSDPFESGVVDSIYFDTLDGAAYRECANGEPRKTKFRIRGYGDASFHQVHRKAKDLFGVAKLKDKIAPVKIHGHTPPDWNALRPLVANSPSFTKIMALSMQTGHLVPAVRVRYFRYRYRLNDYRITLDTNIEIMGFSNGWDLFQDYAVIPHHVLEVKTLDPRPHLPFLGVAQLPQISFSKFFLGLKLLRTGSML
jgi:hypothetical protein